MIFTKNASYLVELQNIGITKNNTEQITQFDTALCPPDKLYSNWVQYPGNTRFTLKTEIKTELQKLYTRGKGDKNKNRIITAEKAYNILHETVTKYAWEQKLTLSVPKIKPFFFNTSEKMEEIMEQMEIDGDREEEDNMEDLFLQDFTWRSNLLVFTWRHC